MKALASIAAAGIFCAACLFAQNLPQPNSTINVDVDLVLVNVTVTDSRNRFVQDLGKEHFRIWEDKVEQEITLFTSEDMPVTLGIVLDRSGSMGSKTPKAGELLDQSRNWISQCMKDVLRDDELFLVEFSDRPEVIVDFTSNPTRLTERLPFLGAGGRTALWDAVYLGVSKVQQGSHPRKALLVLTDGLENRSRYSLSELKGAVREKDVRIYGMDRIEVQFYGLDQLADITGGRVFRSSSPCKELAADLRNQYVIGYRPTNMASNGAWRDIQVKLNPSSLPHGNFQSFRPRTKRILCKRRQNSTREIDMKRTLALSVLLFAIAGASMNALSSQDADPDEVNRQQAERQAAAGQRAEQARAEKNQKAAQDFIDRQRQQSENNLKAAENRLRESRARENEVKFAALQKSARELVDLSIKTFNRLNASGAQSVSVAFLADLDKMEKLVKDLRKAAK